MGRGVAWPGLERSRRTLEDARNVIAAPEALVLGRFRNTGL